MVLNHFSTPFHLARLTREAIGWSLKPWLGSTGRGGEIEGRHRYLSVEGTVMDVGTSAETERSRDSSEVPTCNLDSVSEVSRKAMLSKKQQMYIYNDNKWCNDMPRRTQVLRCQGSTLD